MFFDCTDDEYTIALSYQILAFLAKRADRHKERFARSSMRELMKLTRCFEQGFIDAAVARLIVAGALIPSQEQRDDYALDGFIVPKCAVPREVQAQGDMSDFDVQFLKQCGVALEVCTAP